MRRHHVARRAAAAGVGALVALLGCGGSSTERPAVAAIELSASAVAVEAGTDAPLTARLLDAGGRELDARGIVWTSRDPAVADVAQSSGRAAVVRGRAAGVTQIAANAEGRSAVATVTVSPRAVAAVSVQPAAVDLRVGGTTELRVRALDAAGAELTGRRVAFTSSDPAVATVSDAGLVTAVRPGGATVTVSSEQRTALVAVTVTPVPVVSVTVSPASPSVVVGANVQFEAAAADSAGRPVSGRTVLWTSSDEQVVRVTSAGLATAIGPGTARITATVEGRTASQTVTVLPRPAAAVVVTAPQTTPAVGDAVQLAVRVTDAAGNVLTGRTVAFASDSPSVATVSESGVVTARSPGRATISATVEGVRGTLAIRVVPVPVAAVEVTPSTVELIVGRTVRLTATPRGASGAALPGRTVTWTSGAPLVVTVGQDGVVTGITPGAGIVFAEVEGVVGQVSVRVRAAATAVAPALRFGAAPPERGVSSAVARSLPAHPALGGERAAPHTAP